MYSPKIQSSTVKNTRRSESAAAVRCRKTHGAKHFAISVDVLNILRDTIDLKEKQSTQNKRGVVLLYKFLFAKVSVDVFPNLFSI